MEHDWVSSYYNMLVYVSLLHVTGLVMKRRLVIQVFKQVICCNIVERDREAMF